MGRQGIVLQPGQGPVASYTPGVDGISSVAFSPDGRTVIAGSGTQIKIWDAATGKHLWTFKGHNQGVTALAFRPIGPISHQRALLGLIDDLSQIPGIGPKRLAALRGKVQL